jgi:nucleoid DNA-binding protein
MDELINLVAQKTGIPKEQAKVAVETVLGSLKQRLPAPIASQIDGFLSGNAPQLGDIAGKLFG